MVMASLLSLCSKQTHGPPSLTCHPKSVSLMAVSCCPHKPALSFCLFIQNRPRKKLTLRSEKQTLRRASQPTKHLTVPRFYDGKVRREGWAQVEVAGWLPDV